MKNQLLVVLTAALFSLGAVNPFATYSDSVSGSQTASPEADGIAVNLNAKGDLPGMTKIILQRSGENVTGGTWTMTVLPQNADSASSERGGLSGTVTSGTLTLNADGTLASVSSVQLTIQGGTGEYANISTGSGTVSLSSNAEIPSQFTGTLVLDF